MMSFSVISLLLLAAASSTAAESPFAKYTGGVEPLYVAELGKEYTGWEVTYARKYTSMADVVSDKCGSIDCPDGLAELPGDNIFYFNQDFPRYISVQFVPPYLENKNFTTILSYVRFYTGESDIVEYSNSGSDLMKDFWNCYFSLQTDQYVDGFPRVCWYENLFSIPLDANKDMFFETSITLFERCRTFLAVESYIVGFFDVDVNITAHSCSSYPVEGTCVDTFNRTSNSTIYPVDNSTIYHPVDNSTIYHPVDNSTIYHPVDNSTIYHPVDNSTIYHPVDNSTIYPLANSTIHAAENSTIYAVDNSTSHLVENSTQQHVTVPTTRRESNITTSMQPAKTTTEHRRTTYHNKGSTTPARLTTTTPPSHRGNGDNVDIQIDVNDKYGNVDIKVDVDIED